MIGTPAVELMGADAIGVPGFACASWMFLPITDVT